MDANIDQRRRLVDGNALFLNNMDSAYLRKLSAGQHPFIAILTCSDSRVVPERIFSLNIGDAFVVRVVGNTVVDSVAMGSLEYAVEHLKVKDILVLGHTGCGAVKAAMSPDGSEPAKLRTTLKEIEKAKYKLPTDQQDKAELVSENNVRLQVKAIQTGSTLIGRRVAEGSVRVYGAVYDIVTGNVKFI